MDPSSPTPSESIISKLLKLASAIGAGVLSIMERTWIMLRGKTIALWHWSATWKWWDWLLVGAYVVSLTIHEFWLALFSLFLCAFCLVSIIWQSTGKGLLVKVLQTGAICGGLIFLAWVTVQEKEDRPWSHILTLLDMQERVHVRCKLPADMSACNLECTVENPHSSPSEVSIGFNGIYPYETHLAAGTETRMVIRKQETLPEIMKNGYIDRGLQAFSVDVPLIPSKSSFAFSLWTNSGANEKACEYLRTTIREKQKNKIDILITANPKMKLEVNKVISQEAKLRSLFIPGSFVSKDGRRKVEFIDISEETAGKLFASVYKEQGKSIPSPVCLIPIFAVERNDGGIQYIANPASMMTWEFNKESWKQTAKGFETVPYPPDKYICWNN